LLKNNSKVKALFKPGINIHLATC